MNGELMRVSQVISALQDIMNKYGDMDICIESPVYLHDVEKIAKLQGAYEPYVCIYTSAMPE